MINRKFSAKELAEIINAELSGNPNIMINGLNRIEDAVEGELSFYSDKKFEKYLISLKASCLIVPLDFDYSFNHEITILKVENPYKSLVKILQYIDSLSPNLKHYIDPASIIEKSAQIDESAYIGPNCIIGKNVVISENVVLKSAICIYDNVKIGNGTFIHNGVTICNDTVVGNNCIIHPGAVIGSDGFGFIENSDGSYEKIPQLGNVIIEDNVEIGANTTIDRAIVGSTIIGKGVKIDNLCQIAHNVKIGENSAMAAHVGIAGSCTVGKRNRLGGQVGLAGHLETADDVIIYAQSGVAKSVEKKGIYFGSPVKDRLQAFKIEAALNMLPDLVKEVGRLKRELEKLKIES